jgi:aryl-alcohol dehydrogenase-like predicted oxidoreductase
MTAVQSEYSLWTRDPEDGVLETCRRLGIGFVAYSPLGRGFLTDEASAMRQVITGEQESNDALTATDYRKVHPRFAGEAGAQNLALVERLQEVATAKNATVAQLALAWVLTRGSDVVPIPGTKRRKWLAENIGASDIQLTDADLAAIEATFPREAVAGLRYAEASMKSLNG